MKIIVFVFILFCAIIYIHLIFLFNFVVTARSVGTVEYTGCISAKGQDPHPTQRVSWA